MIVEVKCAWCGCYMGTKQIRQVVNCGPPVSYGMCSACRKKVMAEIDAVAKAYQKHQSKRKGE